MILLLIFHTMSTATSSLLQPLHCIIVDIKYLTMGKNPVENLYLSLYISVQEMFILG